MMGKKSVGGTLLFSISLQWEKRVGGTLSDFHRTEGEKKSVVHSFSPSVRWGKRVGGTLFSPICKVGGKRVGGTLFLPICKVGRKSGGYTVSFVCWDQSCLDMYLTH